MLTDASTSALTGPVVWQIAQEEMQVLEEQAMKPGLEDRG